MEKETILLVIAENGLKTAAIFLTAKAIKQEKQADKAKVKETAEKLKKDAAKTKKLAAILTAADQGITTYLSQLDDEG